MGYGPSIPPNPDYNELVRLMLCQEHPDLMEKLNLFNKLEKDFVESKNRLNKFNMLERIFKTRTYMFIWRITEQRKRKMILAKEDFLVLEKLLKD